MFQQLFKVSMIVPHFRIINYIFIVICFSGLFFYIYSIFCRNKLLRKIFATSAFCAFSCTSISCYTILGGIVSKVIFLPLVLLVACWNVAWYFWHKYFMRLQASNIYSGLSSHFFVRITQQSKLSNYYF